MKTSYGFWQLAIFMIVVASWAPYHTISTASLMLLFLLALFVWPGVMLWAVLVFFVAEVHSDLPLDDLTPLTPGRRSLGYATFVLLDPGSAAPRRMVHRRYPVPVCLIAA
ncbi:MAG: hypothetical protein M3167_08750 [Acidobacteriota bacterium]|nr:hypothetical protein [Acidobacteriota bacterium]